LSSPAWRPLENLEIHLVGPVNSPGVTPVDRKVPKFSTTGLSLYEFPTDPSGNLTAEFVIPFDDGINGIGGNLANIPRPGIYKIYAIRPSATTVLDRADSTSFVLCPDTIFC